MTLFVGLTGGIASGKSTVARLLAGHGALVVDADAEARAALEPGTDVHRAVARRFGPEILRADGSVDRSALAAVVFVSDEARRDLEALVHPAVWAVTARRLGEARAAEADDGRPRVVVLDAPLIVETLPEDRRAAGPGGLPPYDALVVVAARPEDQLERSLRLGWADADVRARLAAQAPPERKLAVADFVIDNRGSLEDLERSVAALWDELTRLPGRAG